MSTISEHIAFLTRNDKNFRDAIANEDGMECKKLSYSHSLYEGVLKSASQIVNSFLQDEPDFYSIRRYYLKPFLEDFINLYNIGKYGKDYVRAMHVHFMSEDFDIDARYRDDYYSLGVRFNKDEEISKEHTTDKLYQHYGKIKLDIRNKMNVDTEKNRYSLSLGVRISLANISDTSGVSLRALYDYANIHHHYDLRFKWLMEENNGKFSSLLLTKLDKYIEESVKVIHDVFKIKLGSPT